VRKSGSKMEEKNLAFQSDQGGYGLPPSMGLNGPEEVKILQVIVGLGPGGIENWLMHLLRHIDRQRFKIDFLVHESPHLYEDEAVTLGSKIILCPYPAKPWSYAANCLHLLREHGPYQIIHTHMPRSGYIHLLARHAGILMRIHHCHNDETIRRTQVSWRRRFSSFLSYRLIRRYATHGLAVSRTAALGAFGPYWQADRRWEVFPASIDLLPFTESVNRQDIRGEFGLPESAFVLGHVGRLAPVKNHGFLIDITAEVCREMPEAYLLMVGDGELRPGIEEKVARLGLGRRVIFAGTRLDVPRLLRGAMDIFVFPSIFEGMGMAVLEAQAAGLPCLISDTVPEEAEVIPGLLQRISLAEGAQGWAKAILAARDNRLRLSPVEAINRMRGTLFDIEANVRHLEALYTAGLPSQLRAQGQWPGDSINC
jgi:glycosyltransferase involved in cell wall biosynthesis